MKILIIDTSGPVCGTAVMDEERVYSEFTAQNRNTHSANLMPMVENALHAAGAALSDLDAIAAVTGPGSFTGVRIGVATAKGLAHGCTGRPGIRRGVPERGKTDGRYPPEAGRIPGNHFRPRGQIPVHRRRRTGPSGEDHGNDGRECFFRRSASGLPSAVSRGDDRPEKRNRNGLSASAGNLPSPSERTEKQKTAGGHGP